MPSTYSPLKIELIATGEQSGTWGATTNTNLGTAIEEAITGSADVAFSSADVTVTLTDTNASQTARNLRLNLTGTSGGARQLILGSGCQIEKLYLINNGLADAVTVKNTTGTGIAVPAGKTMFVYNNGTNVVDATTHLTSLTTGALSASGAVTFTAGTASTSTTTGTAVITGGLGVSGRINAANFDGIVGANTAAAGSFTTLSATGVATFSAGTVSLPAITTSGDTNTGIYFPAADTIAFTEGGVESMRITAAGELAVGTTASVGNSQVTAYGASNGQIAVQNSTNWSRLLQNAGDLYIDNGVGGTAGNIIFRNSISTTERMRIDSSGNVGIGTSSPTRILDIRGTTGTFAVTSTTGTNFVLGTFGNTGGALRIGAEGSSGGSLLTGASAYSGIIGTDSAYPLSFGTNATERMRIDSSGRVGIGVSPTVPLDLSSSLSARTVQINSTAANGVGLALQTSGTDNIIMGSYKWATGSGNATDSAMLSTGFLAIGAGSTERMRITSNGGLCVGTTIDPGSGNINLVNSGFYGWGGLDSLIGGTSAASGFIYFRTGGAEKMRIDSSGNVGIGTSSPSVKLDVVGSGKFTGITEFTNAINLTTSTLNYVYFNDAVAFSRNGVGERMRITSGGFLKASNTGTYFGATDAYHELRSNQNTNIVVLSNTAASGNIYGPYIAFTGQNPNNTTSYFLQCTDAGEKATIRSNGGIANFSANNVNLSDRREKTNFAPSKSYLDTICSIPVQTFNYIDQNMEEDSGLTLGVVAQDVQAVAPELVHESNWAGKDQPEKMRLSIYQTDLQYALMKCIQEQQQIINDLKARIETLESK